MARTHRQFVIDVDNRNNNTPNFKIKIKEGSYYVGLDTNITFQCCNGHPDFITKPRYIIQKGSGCPKCKKQKSSISNSKGLNQFITQLSAITTIKLYPATQRYINTNTKLQFKCDNNHIFNTIPKSLLAGHGCPQCANIKRHKINNIINSTFSISETLVQEFTILAQSVPNMNVELIPIGQPYDKYQYINQLSSTTKSTIFVFEDEWATNKLLIKSKLEHYAHCNVVQSIYARQCIIKEITPKQKQLFLEANHIQGNDNCQLAFGAFYNEQLVATMTFSAPRIAVGASGKNREQYIDVWELSRFCTDTQYRIPGIASKLLTYFKRNHPWKEIYSFADRRWSTGNMYNQLGFKLVATNGPDYFYVIDGIRKHRWNYRKDILKNTLSNYDPTLTEYQNMINHGYWRVWGCGTLKFSMKNE